MSKKKAFALRMNEDMLKAVEKWASDEFRSTNGQIEWMLMQFWYFAHLNNQSCKNLFSLTIPLSSDF